MADAKTATVDPAVKAPAAAAAPAQTPIAPANGKLPSAASSAPPPANDSDVLKSLDDKYTKDFDVQKIVKELRAATESTTAWIIDFDENKIMELLRWMARDAEKAGSRSTSVRTEYEQQTKKKLWDTLTIGLDDAELAEAAVLLFGSVKGLDVAGAVRVYQAFDGYNDFEKVVKAIETSPNKTALASTWTFLFGKLFTEDGRLETAIIEQAQYLLLDVDSIRDRALKALGGGALSAEAVVTGLLSAIPQGYVVNDHSYDENRVLDLLRSIDSAEKATAVLEGYRQRSSWGHHLFADLPGGLNVSELCKAARSVFQWFNSLDIETAIKVRQGIVSMWPNDKVGILRAAREAPSGQKVKDAWKESFGHEFGGDGALLTTLKNELSNDDYIEAEKVLRKK